LTPRIFAAILVNDRTVHAYEGEEMSKTNTIAMIVLLYIVATCTLADIPHTMSYQGRITNSDGTPVGPGPVFMQFSVHDASVDGNEPWPSSGYDPVEADSNGLVSHLLGSTNPLPDSLAMFDSLWLEIAIQGDDPIEPRTTLSSVVYSLKSLFSDSTAHSLDKTVDAGELLTGTLDTDRYSAYQDLQTEDKIGDQTGQLADGGHSHEVGGLSTIMNAIPDSVRLFMGSGRVLLKSVDIPAGLVNSFFRSTWCVETSPEHSGSVEFVFVINGVTVYEQLDYVIEGGLFLTLYGMKRSDGSEQWYIGANLLFQSPRPSLQSVNMGPGATIELWVQNIDSPGDVLFFFHRAVLEAN